MVQVRVLDEAERTAGPRQATDALDLARRLPRIAIEARRIAATAAHGIHGRRQAGPGEAFWQFRPFTFGEPAPPRRLAPLRARRPLLCARARMGGGPHHLALDRPLRLDGLCVLAGAGAQDRARAGARPRAGRHPGARRRARRPSRPHQPARLALASSTGSPRRSRPTAAAHRPAARARRCRRSPRPC